jgi:GNAT superfamily N-acetyltransferase
MKGLLRSLVPCQQTHLIFARALTPADADTTAEVPGVTIESPSDANALDEFCIKAGFPVGWTAEMVQAGAHAIIARDAADIIAMAWHTARPFFVAEIDFTFVPHNGEYLFGDYVAPAHRGRKLQRLLVRHRLAAAARNGAAIAYTIIHADNAASLASYRALGFVPTTRLTRTRWLGRDRDHVAPISTRDRSLPTFIMTSPRRLLPQVSPAAP